MCESIQSDHWVLNAESFISSRFWRDHGTQCLCSVCQFSVLREAFRSDRYFPSLCCWWSCGFLVGFYLSYDIQESVKLFSAAHCELLPGWDRKGSNVLCHNQESLRMFFIYTLETCFRWVILQPEWSVELNVLFLSDHREFAFRFKCSARVNHQHTCFSPEPMPELLILRFHQCNPDFTLSGYFLHTC